MKTKLIKTTENEKLQMKEICEKVYKQIGDDLKTVDKEIKTAVKRFSFKLDKQFGYSDAEIAIIKIKGDYLEILTKRLNNDKLFFNEVIVFFWGCKGKQFSTTDEIISGFKQIFNFSETDNRLYKLITK